MILSSLAVRFPSIKSRRALRLYGGFICLFLLGFTARGPQAQSREIKCKGSLGKISVGRVRVPRGAQCHLRGTIVRGPVIVEDKATLKTSGAKINGHIRSFPGNRLTIDGKTQFWDIKPLKKSPKTQN